LQSVIDYHSSISETLRMNRTSSSRHPVPQPLKSDKGLKGLAEEDRFDRIASNKDDVERSLSNLLNFQLSSACMDRSWQTSAWYIKINERSFFPHVDVLKPSKH
jgi:hypothetical protein